LEMDMDAGTGTLFVNDAETDCQNLAIPFGQNMPVSGLGFLLDNTAATTTWIDNVGVDAEPEEFEPIDDDDDDDDDSDEE